jgi:DNA repair protein RecN (Recombination protein N)
VQGVFVPPFSVALLDLLNELGLAEDADGGEVEELILSREISASGRSAARINMRPVPLTVLRSVGRLLINIHGQRENVLLLEPENQLHLLDSFGDSFGGAEHGEQRRRLAEAYHSWQQADSAWRKAAKESADDEERRRFLQFQIAELEAANLRAGESEELAVEAAALDSVQKRSEHAGAAYDTLYDSTGSVLSGLTDVLRHLTELSHVDESVAPLVQRVQNLYYELEDSALEVRDYKDGIVDDPARLEEINSRQYDLKILGKKYNADEERLLQILADNKEELAHRENREEYLAELEKNAAKLLEVYQREAAAMRELRLKSGQELAARITSELAYLQMPKATFAVELVPKQPAADGCDEVAFMISPNPGEEMKPVARIASGGEMSRIMLAIKVILAGLDDVPTLIFDEIDTGLGGRALVSVAEKLAEVSRCTQSICVTHAPVLAAYADNNLLVEKREEAGRTVTTVQELGASEKVTEISRMLAGDKVSATTIQQAQELIEAGEALKHN